MTVFFTADTHFGHAGALRLYRRPFASVAEMDAAMIDRWNATVEDTDAIWHLGDFSKHLALPAAAERLARLRGCKHLITGNNDPPAVAGLADWESVQTYAEIVVDDIRLVLCHYAFRTWNGMGKGALNLHGHSHGRLKPQTRQVDVGVDVWDFRPVTLAEIRRRRRGRAASAVAEGDPAAAGQGL